MNMDRLNMLFSYLDRLNQTHNYQCHREIGEVITFIRNELGLAKVHTIEVPLNGEVTIAIDAGKEGSVERFSGTAKILVIQ